jgi:RNA polymerase sigma factor (sigma-70 family)
MKSLATWTNEDAKKALARYERDVFHSALKMSRLIRSGMIDQTDLESEGRVAVLEALQTYEGYGVRERTWVQNRINQRMMDVVRQADIKTRGERSLETDEQRRVYRKILSIKEKIKTEDARTYEDIIPDPAASIRALDDKESRRALVLWAAEKERLTDRQKGVLFLSLESNGGYGPRDIGIILGVTEGRVSQLMRRACERVRDFVTQNLGDEV